MKINRYIPLVLIAFSTTFFACSDDDDDNPTSSSSSNTNTPTTNNNLRLDLQGLEDLDSNYRYENWIIVDGAPVSAGLFDVDANGNLSETNFTVDPAQLSKATTYVLTIEPNPDTDPAPSDVHILAGDFSGRSASASVSHSAALGDDFTASTGGYMLATPTDGSATTDENSGVWFLDPANGTASLSLPSLPNGWIYEGWAVINGIPVSTGTFSAEDMRDNSAPFSGTAAAGPPYPGEDFLMNAPAGLSFPTDLSSGTIVISIEPVPDNSTAPFILKPLVGQVPSMASDRTLYNMMNNALATNPMGTVSR